MSVCMQQVLHGKMSLSTSQGVVETCRITDRMADRWVALGKGDPKLRSFYCSGRTSQVPVMYAMR